MLLRLHKYLADCGTASRRKCEEFIREGLITVNGKIVREMGIKIDPEKDIVQIGKEIARKKNDFVYFILHKPVGYVCSVTGPEEPKIMDLLRDIPERVWPVGRLDKMTSGLLLITNDGRFAYEMTHPKFNKEKEYVIKTRESITPAHIQKMEERFFIDGRKTEPITILLKSPHRFHAILTEGRNRQIRRMCQRAGLRIEKLKRIRIGGLMLGDIAPGKHKKLKSTEFAALFPGQSPQRSSNPTSNSPNIKRSSS